MKKVYGGIQVTSNLKKYPITVGEESGRDYISRTYVTPYSQPNGGRKVTEMIYLDEFIQPSPVFNNEYFGQHNTLAEAGYLITLTEDFEAILYKFCPVPHKPVGVKVSSKQLRVMGRAK